MSAALKNPNSLKIEPEELASYASLPSFRRTYAILNGMPEFHPNPNKRLLPNLSIAAVLALGGTACSSTGSNNYTKPSFPQSNSLESPHSSSTGATPNAAGAAIVCAAKNPDEWGPFTTTNANQDMIDRLAQDSGQSVGALATGLIGEVTCNPPIPADVYRDGLRIKVTGLNSILGSLCFVQSSISAPEPGGPPLMGADAICLVPVNA